ncbi:ATP-binding protein [Roseomonas fluvialis]|uniref:ATP-binding protein n=1 Tax=Roseomonas fluvialis TaxID=1750527 RepID=UPI001FCBFB65|nr:winged helix-turn-helix domain-containing protein [Roseomonas fluvialis]
MLFGDFAFYPQSGTLTRHGVPVTLGGPARALLAALMEDPGAVVSAQYLAERAWPGQVRGEANLRVQISALRRVLGTAPDMRGAILNIPGRGYQFVLPVRPAGTVQAMSGAPDESSGRLPPMLGGLIGRDEELAGLHARLARHRLVTLVGVGGIGKTSLAVAAAHGWAADTGERPRFLDVTTIADGSLLPAAVAGAVGLGTPGFDPVEEMAAALGQAGTLLVLDNVEHLLPATAQLTRALLQRLPRLRILVTSREPLQSEGECVQLLRPLRLPPVDAPGGLAQVLRYPAAQLLVERAAARLGDFQPRESDAADLARLCHRLDGLPLAITLAASRIDMFGIAGLAADSSSLLSVQNLARRGRSDRHRTMRSTLDWSYRALLPTDQRRLRRLSVLHGPFTAATAAIMAAEQDQEPLLRGLERLERKSLISRAEDAGGVPRWRLLHITRAFAAELLAEAGEAPKLRERHARHMLREVRAALAERQRTDPAAWRAAHQALPEDLRVAVDWALGPDGDRRLALGLIAESAPAWLALGHAAEFRRRVERAIDAEGVGGTPEVARLHLSAAIAILHNTGEVLVIGEHLRRAVEVSDAHGDDATALSATVLLWMATVMEADGAAAARLAEDVERRIAPGTPDDDPVVVVHGRMVGLTRFMAGDIQESRRRLGVTLRHAPDVMLPGTLIDHTVVTRALEARLLWVEGFPEKAWEAAQVAHHSARAVDHALSLAFALCFALCPIALWNGEATAMTHVRDLIAIGQSHRMPYWRDWGRCFEGAVPLSGGLPPGLPKDIDPTPFHLEMLGTLHPTLAEPATIARVDAGQAGWCAPELLRAKAERLLIRAASEPGVLRPAERILRQALDLAEHRGMRGWALRSATSLARVLCLKGEHAAARRLLEPVMARVTEGFAMPDFRIAQALLDGCA